MCTATGRSIDVSTGGLYVLNGDRGRHADARVRARTAVAAAVPGGGGMRVK